MRCKIWELCVYCVCCLQCVDNGPAWLPGMLFCASRVLIHLSLASLVAVRRFTDRPAKVTLLNCACTTWVHICMPWECWIHASTCTPSSLAEFSAVGACAIMHHCTCSCFQATVCRMFLKQYTNSARNNVEVTTELQSHALYLSLQHRYKHMLPYHHSMCCHLIV